jgi:hypothetical protein
MEHSCISIDSKRTKSPSFYKSQSSIGRTSDDLKLRRQLCRQHFAADKIRSTEIEDILQAIITMLDGCACQTPVSGGSSMALDLSSLISSNEAHCCSKFNALSYQSKDPALLESISHAATLGSRIPVQRSSACKYQHRTMKEETCVLVSGSNTS